MKSASMKSVRFLILPQNIKGGKLLKEKGFTDLTILNIWHLLRAEDGNVGDMWRKDPVMGQERTAGPDSGFLYNLTSCTNTFQGHSPNDQRTSHWAFLPNIIIGLNVHSLDTIKLSLGGLKSCRSSGSKSCSNHSKWHTSYGPTIRVLMPRINISGLPSFFYLINTKPPNELRLGRWGKSASENGNQTSTTFMVMESIGRLFKRFK